MSQIPLYHPLLVSLDVTSSGDATRQHHSISAPTFDRGALHLQSPNAQINTPLRLGFQFSDLLLYLLGPSILHDVVMCDTFFE